jgi:hypothetical protein
MLGIGLVNILDGKVVDHEGEGDRTGGMTEKSRCVLDWRVIGKGQVLDEAAVGLDAGLWKAIHTFFNLGEDMSMVGRGCTAP